MYSSFNNSLVRELEKAHVKKGGIFVDNSDMAVAGVFIDGRKVMELKTNIAEFPLIVTDPTELQIPSRKTLKIYMSKNRSPFSQPSVISNNAITVPTFVLTHQYAKYKIEGEHDWRGFGRDTPEVILNIACRSVKNGVLLVDYSDQEFINNLRKKGVFFNGENNGTPSISIGSDNEVDVLSLDGYGPEKEGFTSVGFDLQCEQLKELVMEQFGDDIEDLISNSFEKGDDPNFVSAVVAGEFLPMFKSDNSSSLNSPNMMLSADEDMGQQLRSLVTSFGKKAFVSPSSPTI